MSQISDLTASIGSMVRENHVQLCRKFCDFKQRQNVRGKSRALKGTNYYNKEQFPPEINSESKELVKVMKEKRQQGHKTRLVYRCHYTKSNPIDDHSNISSKKLQKHNFKPLGHYTCLQCGTSHLQKVQENILSRIILATYRKFTVATVRFT